MEQTAFGTLLAVLWLALLLGPAYGLVAGIIPPGLSRSVAVVIAVGAVSSFLHLPFTLIRTFRLEARFGSNRTTPLLFLLDQVKSGALQLALTVPLLYGFFALQRALPNLWWLFGWAALMAVMFLMTWAYPAFIAPLFNKFSPLKDEILKTRIEDLLIRCGFKSQGVFVVDNSRRSSHGNAYFTGIGTNKRIVFFDTLLERLAHPEVEAVLAHELGHFSLKHVRKRLLVSIATTFIALAILGWLTGQPTFYTALGVPNPSTHAALLLFILAAPFFTFFITPLSSLWSRRHEFEADSFATQHASANELATALVKLYRDNANTLTPDPLYVAFHYSHPPALERISRLRMS